MLTPLPLAISFELNPYKLSLFLLGIAFFGAVILPRVLEGRAMSHPIIYMVVGAMLFMLPLPLPDVDPRNHPKLAEHLTELIVIIALMGTGLKLQRPFNWREWSASGRLLLIAMPLTIGAITLLGLQMLSLPLASALLLGSLLAPTDPVLASDVQVRAPNKDKEREVRFGLTSEAGLNDGLAFPFVNLAIALVLASQTGEAWLWDWFSFDVVYKLVVGVAIGWIAGRAIAWLVFSTAAKTVLAHAMEGSIALAATILTYGLTEIAHGYGFLAVFVAAQQIRHWHVNHKYQHALHDFTEDIERLLMSALLVLFGGTLVSGILSGIGWLEIVATLIILLIIRPVIGWLSLLGSRFTPYDRFALAFFGIRGLGSMYYLAYAVNHAQFDQINRLWSITALVMACSIVLHGITAGPIITWVEQHDDEEKEAEAVMSPAPTATS